MLYQRPEIKPRRFIASIITGTLCVCVLLGAVSQGLAQTTESNRNESSTDAQVEAAQRQLIQARQQLDQQKRMLQVQRELMERELDQARRQLEFEVAVYSLRHIKAAAVAEVLQTIYGDQAPRVAVDEPRNRLLVIADDEMHDAVRNVVEQLDQPAEVAEKPEPTAETLQLRIVWVVDDQDSVLKPAHVRLDSHVIEGLAELGIESPKIVCRPLTSVVVYEDDRSRFEMQVPVVLANSLVRLHANGEINWSGSNKYFVRLNLGIMQPAEGGFGGDRRAPHLVDSFEGSIVTALGHYMVLGTSVVVPTPANGSAPGKQFPCAFVVYLDRARTFPAE